MNDFQSRPKRIHTLIFVFVTLISACCFCPAQGFKVEGDIYNSVYRNSNWVVTAHFTFEACSLGKSWQLSSVSTNGQTIRMGGDGTNSYKLLEDVNAAKRLNMKVNIGNVFKGQYPVQSPDGRTSIPWLAYCSRDYIEKSGSRGGLRLPAPWLTASAQPLAHIYYAEVVTNEYGLPSTLRYLPDTEVIDSMREGRSELLKGLSDTERDKVIVSLAYYEKISEPEAVYQTLTFTNIGNIVIPLEFQFEKFAFRSSKSGKERRPSSKIIGRINSVEAISLLDPQPRSGGAISNIQVADYRLADSEAGVGFIPYIAQNSIWLSEDDPKLQQLRAERVNSSNRHLGFKQASRGLVVLCILTLIAAPFVVGYIRRKRSQANY